MKDKLLNRLIIIVIGLLLSHCKLGYIYNESTDFYSDKLKWLLTTKQDFILIHIASKLNYEYKNTYYTIIRFNDNNSKITRYRNNTILSQEYDADLLFENASILIDIINKRPQKGDYLASASKGVYIENRYSISINGKLLAFRFTNYGDYSEASDYKLLCDFIKSNIYDIEYLYGHKWVKDDNLLNSK